ncbi:DUF3995 domain-containing protein [Aquibacillus halophilus]|uniref:DUF3995 domain-containing protein n=1 Tax=Aquibacillus halophilus TaxID=930132 RepID=A0A6A8DI81_9BACI|nr:DUF3995 domain-containing protein [Aquibacillus halophilus]MRH43451.1 DUF3995 domain-containing protein [Aquibacillus halophilus]
MTDTLILLSAITILLLISGVHFYWAFGGTWGSSVVLPQKEGGEQPIFTPRVFETVSVAILILAACCILLIQANMVPFFQANFFSEVGSYIVASVFVLRAIGDFKYLGFFKRIRQTKFAKYDTKYFSPLCLYLALSFVVAVIF